MSECSYCERRLGIGSEVYQIKHYPDAVFCCVGCAKEYVRSFLLEDAIETFLEEKLEDCSIEEDDPYGRYGLNRGDF